MSLGTFNLFANHQLSQDRIGVAFNADQHSHARLSHAHAVVVGVDHAVERVIAAVQADHVQDRHANQRSRSIADLLCCVRWVVVIGWQLPHVGRLVFGDFETLELPQRFVVLDDLERGRLGRIFEFGKYRLPGHFVFKLTLICDGVGTRPPGQP